MTYSRESWHVRLMAHKLIKSVCSRHVLVCYISCSVRSKDQCHMTEIHLNSCCVRRYQNACNNSIVTMHQEVVYLKCLILDLETRASSIIISMGTFHGWLTCRDLITNEWRISRRISSLFYETKGLKIHIFDGKNSISVNNSFFWSL